MIVVIVPLPFFAFIGSFFFVGRRYLLNGDMATMLLFDNHGKIAGMQMGVRKYFKNWLMIDLLVQYTPVKWDSQGTIKIGPT